MTSLPDSAANERRAWLCRLQAPVQSDFETSVVWRSTLIAALIVIVINIPASPPVTPAQAAVRSTV
ncbi:hypothetical protein PQR71_12885 [Paraburkholderia fungorum]|uniref:hypothetical protein n=1 Tax=Paraburkholderia fungorum TaxID=134537 RepID=UPI0038BDD208